MKNKTQRKPTAGKFSLLGQICNLIPAHLVPKLARDTGVIKRSRTFTPWSHVVSLLYAQLTHALGLNDVCDALRLHSGPLWAVRGATPPSKNALSTANRERSAQMAQDLFYAVLGHLEKLHPGFGRDRRPRFAFRFKRVIHLVDTAGEHESLRAREVCAGVRAGEIVIFDKAYVDFTHLADLSARDVFWVTRAKDNLRCRVLRRLQHGVQPGLAT